MIKHNSFTVPDLSNHTETHFYKKMLRDKSLQGKNRLQDTSCLDIPSMLGLWVGLESGCRKLQFPKNSILYA